MRTSSAATSSARRATALFIIIPTSFLIILYVKSASEGNVSGGFSQKYYDESKKRGDKKTNEAAVLKGKGLGMRPGGANGGVNWSFRQESAGGGALIHGGARMVLCQSFGLETVDFS